MIRVERAILHIIDKEGGRLVCSGEQLDLKEYATRQYVESIIDKIDKAEFKKSDGQQSLELSALVTEKIPFVQKSIDLADWIFEALAISEDAPSGDLMIFEYIEDGEHEKIGIVKFNYNPSFTHSFDHTDSVVKSKIVINRTSYPSISQKIQEGLFVNKKTLELEIVEKKYTFEDNKKYFFSEHLLQMEVQRTVTSNIDLIRKAVKHVAGKYNQESYVSMGKTQQAIYESIEKDESINIEEVAEAVFEGNHSAKTEFFEIIETNKFKGEILKNVATYENKLSKHKFVLSNGVKLEIPVEVYKDKEMVEFINNPNGTITITIKDVDTIESKF